MVRRVDPCGPLSKVRNSHSSDGPRVARQAQVHAHVYVYRSHCAPGAYPCSRHVWPPPLSRQKCLLVAVPLAAACDVSPAVPRCVVRHDMVCALVPCSLQLPMLTMNSAQEFPSIWQCCAVAILGRTGTHSQPWLSRPQIRDSP